MNTLAPVLVLTTPFFVLQAAEGVDFHVAPDGSDDQPGSKSEPFATLERARDEIRKRKQQGSLAGPVTVLVRGGTYHFAKSLELDVRDSGTPAAPIVWRAATDQEVRLSGGPTLPPDVFRPVADQDVLQRLKTSARSNVFQADLRAFGVGNSPMPSTIS